MAYDTYIYEAADGASSFKIRLDTDQATLSGAIVAGTTTQGFHVRVKKSRRAYGLNPRHIVAKRKVGVAPADKTFFTYLAICTEAAFAAIETGSAVLINGITWVVDRKEPETKK
jgi:hypothetical protein